MGQRGNVIHADPERHQTKVIKMESRRAALAAAQVVRAQSWCPRTAGSVLGQGSHENQPRNTQAEQQADVSFCLSICLYLPLSKKDKYT